MTFALGVAIVGHKELLALGLKAHYMTARGNAPGTRNINKPSPEGAAHF
jgi:hypothetical protein